MIKESKQGFHVKKLTPPKKNTHVMKEVEYKLEGKEWVGFYAIPTKREEEFKKNKILFLQDMDSDTLRLLKKDEFTGKEEEERKAANDKFQKKYEPQHAKSR